MKYVTTDGTTAIVSIDGRFDLIKTLEVEQEINDAIHQRGCDAITFDLDSTRYIDSSANRLMKKSRDIIGAENFSVINVTATAVRKALKTAKLDILFRIQ